MAERTVSVRLTADAAQYLRTFDEVARKSQDTASKVEEQLRRQQEAYQRVGAVALSIGVLAAAGFTAAVASYASFDAAMSNVQAATHASAEEQELLRQAALDAGAATVYSAEEAAQAIEELAKAGLSTAQILGGGLTAALDLAAAGELEVARAAEITAITLQQFRLSGEQATHVADLLAAGAGKAVGSVDDLANGLKFVGPIAASMGVSIEETTGVLALFAQQGIIGEQAGTSLRGVLASLTSPSAAARREIEALGLTLYDSEGNFLGLRNAAEQLSMAYSDMDGASRDASMGIVFGRETITAATALYRAGADGVQEWTDAVDDSGYAAETAAMRLDNLRGDLEELSGSAETFMIELGEAGDGPMRALVQAATAVINGFTDMPEPMQIAALAALGLVGALGLTSGAMLTLIPRIAETRAAWALMTTTAAGSRSTLAGVSALLGGPWGIALTVATGAVIGLTAAISAASASSSEWQNVLQTGTRSGQTLLETAGELQFGVDSLGSALDEMGSHRILWMDALGGDEAATAAARLDGLANNLNEIGAQLAETARGGNVDAARSMFQALADDANLTEEQIGTLINRMPEWRDALIEQATQQGRNVTSGSELQQQEQLVAFAMEESATAAGESTDAARTLAEQAQTTADEIAGLADEIRGLNELYYGAQDATAAYYQSVDDLQAAIAEGLSPALLTAAGDIDLSTQAGRDAEAMLSKVAENALEAAASMIELDGDTIGATARVQEARDAFLEGAEAAGINAEQANVLADRYGLIPDAVHTAVTNTAPQAETMASLYQRALGRIPEGINTNVSISTAQAEADVQFFLRTRTMNVNVAAQARGGFGVGSQAMPGMIGRASGGILPGPPSSVDNMVIRAASGEFIMNALATSHSTNRALLEWMNAGGIVPAFAGGGLVGAAHYVAAPSVHVAPASLEGLTVLVQSPFTGEYLRGEIAAITDARIHDADDRAALDYRLGGR
ncbi:phage tail tape measure protein [Agrococcus sp. Marseille-Q4369]|uniref:phage tail tape measure protein n=1 Tax=Agrococcus sp. Marseille-Q4369 TaxID=2810513 RepID=UPI001B8BDD39|nr:phage tail tape measure protein [Agrococcus sp. Marseille-Q4369]QUW18897.1 phage tail tape measure protein [Agrococcus sp. Marseille-Q4369]